MAMKTSPLPKSEAPLNDADIISAKLNDMKLKQNSTTASDKIVTGVTANGSSVEPIKTQPIACNQYIPHRQPTIVCEDIADDIDFDDEEQQDEEASNELTGASSSLTQINGDSMTRTSSSSSLTMLQRSASSSSLTVPASEVELSSHCEKRRPPIRTSVSAEQMITI